MTLSEQLKVIRGHQAQPPVFTVPIANDLGLIVYKSKRGSWPTNVSGMIKRGQNNTNSYEIYVNGDHHENRRRFTIAHEIAHFILHQEHIGTGITEDALYRSGLSNVIEHQANAFAADILMPWHLIEEQLHTVGNIERLAKIFQVSKSSMSIRLGVPFEQSNP